MFSLSDKSTVNKLLIIRFFWQFLMEDVEVLPSLHFEKLSFRNC